MTKSFIALAVIALVLGVSLGGAFIGGTIYGQTASGGSGEAATPLGGGWAQAQRGGAGPTGPGGAAAQYRQGNLGRDRGQAAGPSNGSFSPRRSAAGGAVTPQPEGTGGGAAGRAGGAAGVIETVEDGSVTIQTANGPVSVGISEATVIVMLDEAGAGDLSAGVSAIALGRRGTDGLAAQAIVLNPNGVDLSFLGGRTPAEAEGRGSPQP